MLFKLGALTKPGQAPLTDRFPNESNFSAGAGQGFVERS